MSEIPKQVFDLAFTLATMTLKKHNLKIAPLDPKHWRKSLIENLTKIGLEKKLIIEGEKETEFMKVDKNYYDNLQYIASFSDELLIGVIKKMEEDGLFKAT